MTDPRITAAAEWLQADDAAYHTDPIAAARAAREMLSVAGALGGKPPLGEDVRSLLTRAHKVLLTLIQHDPEEPMSALYRGIIERLHADIGVVLKSHA